MPAIPDVPGLEAAGPLTNIEALELDYLPAHLIVLGGGYVGLELAQAYRRFGSRVTIIEHGPQLAGREDPDVADEIQRHPRRRRHRRSSVAAETLRVRGPLRASESACSCARRRASRPSRAATSWSPRGAFPTPPGSGSMWPASRWTIAATSRSTSGWRRARPASGRSASAPAARSSRTCPFDDFRIIRDNLAGGSRTTRDRLVPYCMFTDPPLARVGLSEGEAQRQGIAVRVAKLPMSAVLRTRTIGETQGLHEGACRARSDRILGFTMIGAEAGEVMAAVQTAMLAGLPYTACATPSSRTRRWRRDLAHRCRGCRRSGCCGWTLGGRAT